MTLLLLIFPSLSQSHIPTTLVFLFLKYSKFILHQRLPILLFLCLKDISFLFLPDWFLFSLQCDQHITISERPKETSPSK